jgi:uncharacterized protein YndB with AHSA1/START domain/DNA-binding transcriptional ArsR family regulator
MDDLIFVSLSDPTRRHLLDLLFEHDGRTLADLVAGVPGMTRFGVMKHLRVLEAADLVTTRRVPIRRLHDRWLDKYRARDADSLIDRKRAVENPEETSMSSIAAPAFVSSIYIRATPEAIWRALTETDVTVRYYYGNAIESDWRPGSAYRMTLAGDLQIEGEIVEIDPPRRLVQSWHGVWDEGMAAEAPSRVTWEIEETEPGICRVTLRHDGLVAGSSTLEQVSGGWPYILSGMKTLLETGKGLVEA